MNNDGSPTGVKTWLFWNPPTVTSTQTQADPESKSSNKGSHTQPTLQRGSAIVEVSLLLVECIKQGLNTIAFTRSKKLCEIIVGYTRELLKQHDPFANLSSLIQVYRGGYSMEERRRIESMLFSGKLKAVVATNALELGIDIGHMDVTLHLGYQGSIASMRQQAGRAGRRGEASLAIFVAFDSPLDQYFMRCPKQFFDGPIESVRLDTNNSLCLKSHLLCAAAELPLCLSVSSGLDARLFCGQNSQAVTELVASGLLGRHPRSKSPADLSLYYIGRIEHVASTVSLRHIEQERIRILNESTGLVMEEIEYSMAPFMVYDGAIYMHQGRTFYCINLDLGEKTALVRPCDVRYSTRLIKETTVTMKGQQGNTAGISKVFVGPAEVRTRFEAFHRIKKGTREVIDKVALYLPDSAYETFATYVIIPDQVRRQFIDSGFDFKASCHAASHAILNVLPLFLECDLVEVGTECTISTSLFINRLLIYDKRQGGTGVAVYASSIFNKLIEHALLLLNCNCESGCPTCILLPTCPSHDNHLSKEGARALLQSCSL